MASSKNAISFASYERIDPTPSNRKEGKAGTRVEESLLELKKEGEQAKGAQGEDDLLGLGPGLGLDGPTGASTGGLAAPAYARGVSSLPDSFSLGPGQRVKLSLFLYTTQVGHVGMHCACYYQPCTSTAARESG